MKLRCQRDKKTVKQESKQICKQKIIMSLDWICEGSKEDTEIENVRGELRSGVISLRW